MTNDQIKKARQLAIKAHKQGRDALTQSERNLVSRAVEYMSPENFYMDGELFA